MRWWVECQLNHESVKLTLSRLSQLFEGQPSFYIERVVSLMETIVFNSIQVINYWFTQHRILGPLYQQAQTFSSNIWGISDQNVTEWLLNMSLQHHYVAVCIQLLQSATLFQCCLHYITTCTHSYSVSNSCHFMCTATLHIQWQANKIQRWSSMRMMLTQTTQFLSTWRKSHESPL